VNNTTITKPSHHCKHWRSNTPHFDQCSNHKKVIFILHSFNGLYSRTTRVNRYQKKQNHSGKTNLDLLEQEIVSGSGISWAICKSAPHSRQIPRQHPTTQFFTGQMPFLLPNQKRQSTEGIKVIFKNPCISLFCVVLITLAAAHRPSCSNCLQLLQSADHVTVQCITAQLISARKLKNLADKSSQEWLFSRLTWVSRAFLDFFPGFVPKENLCGQVAQIFTGYMPSCHSTNSFNVKTLKRTQSSECNEWLGLILSTSTTGHFLYQLFVSMTISCSCHHFTNIHQMAPPKNFKPAVCVVA